MRSYSCRSWYTLVIFVCAPLAAAGAQRQFHFTSSSDTTASYQSFSIAQEGKQHASRLIFGLTGLTLHEQKDGFTHIEVKGLSPLTEKGRPALFETGKLFAVPRGFQPALKVVEKQLRTVENVIVKPHQIKARCDCEEAKSFYFDSTLYQSNKAFPRQFSALERVGEVAGVVLYRVALYPMRLQPKSRTLEVLTHWQAELSLKKVFDSPKPTLTKTQRAYLRASVENKEDFDSLVTESRLDERMLIISEATLLPSVRPYEQWLREKGLRVSLLDKASIGNTKEEILAFLKKQYQNLETRPSYVLFVGNKDTLEPFSRDTLFGDALTDYPYSLLDGDEEDVIPDILYGRLLAHNTEDVKRQVNRWIQYEKVGTPSTEWLHAFVAIASEEGGDPTNPDKLSDEDYANSIAETLEQNGYTAITKLFESNSSIEPGTIEEAVSKGASWLSYFGHGLGDKWNWFSREEQFDLASVSRLTNHEGRLPVIIDVACLNAAYGDFDKTFGQAWVTHEFQEQAAGAVAFYGGSTEISWDPPAIMSQGITKKHFESSLSTIGDSILAGQLHLIAEKGINEDTIDNLEWYNLFGSPALVWRTRTPQTYRLSHSAVSRTGYRGIRVKAASEGSPVQQLLISATDSFDHQAVARTDENGIAELEVTDFRGDIRLTSTAYNHESHQTFIENEE